MLGYSCLPLCSITEPTPKTCRRRATPITSIGFGAIPVVEWALRVSVSAAALVYMNASWISKVPVFRQSQAQGSSPSLQQREATISRQPPPAGTVAVSRRQPSRSKGKDTVQSEKETKSITPSADIAASTDLPSSSHENDLGRSDTEIKKTISPSVYHVGGDVSEPRIISKSRTGVHTPSPLCPNTGRSSTPGGGR